jgi:hypothetical protein
MAARKPRNRGIYVVDKRKPNDPESLLKEAMAEQYKTGEIVPYSGIYQVAHAEHRLPHEVTLLRANAFPPCSKCGNNVVFKLLRAVTVERFAVTLNAIPEMTDSQVIAAAAEEDSEQAS